MTKLCFPSLKTLASESGLSIPTVRKCIDNLKNLRYIGVVNHKRKNYFHFRINICRKILNIDERIRLVYLLLLL